VIPKTTTYKQFKERKAKEGSVKSSGIEKGQRTLNGTKSSKPKPLKPKINGDSMDQDRPSTEEPLRSSGAPITLVVDRTVDGGAKEQERDVEMTDQ
jgi:DNA-directed RNA polymerase I subunit RPA43